MQKYKFSVVIPVYNEEDSIKDTLIRVKNIMDSLNETYEIIVVDDGSKDNSMNIVKEFNFVKIVRNKTNMGYGASIKHGVIEASSNNIIITDADGTYPIEDIPKFIEYINDYDMISGARSSKDSNITFIRKIGKFFHHKLINILSEKNVPDMNCGLRLFKRDIFLSYSHLYPNGFSISTTFMLACLINNHPVKFIDINYFKRKGKSKIKIFKDGFNFLLLILRSIVYFNPMKIFLPLSLFFFVLGVFFFSLGLLVGKIPDITIVILGITSILIFLFGLVSDALSKLLSRVQFGRYNESISN